MGRCPHLQKARFQGERIFWVMLSQDAARIVEMEAAYIMRIISDREWLGDVAQIFRRLENEHAGTELAQQHQHARALCGQVVHVVRQHEQPVGGKIGRAHV